jgi:hypothetical protein
MKRVTLLFCLLITSLGFSQAVVLEDFEGTSIVAFANGGGTIMIVDDPETGGTNGNVLEIVTAASQAPWQQAEITFQENYMDLTTTKTVTVDVYSETAFSMLARASAATDPNVVDSAADASHTGSGWETLTFDFSDPRDGLPVAAGVYGKIFLFNNWNVSVTNPNTGGLGFWDCTLPAGGNPCPSRLSYVDNITAVASEAPPGPVPPSTPAPTPPNYTSHLALQSNITDTGSFTNYWEANDYFGSAPAFIDLDESSNLNSAIRLDLSIGWGGGQTADGILETTDVSAFDTVHLDYFIPSAIDPGVNGHQFYLDIISRTGEINTEAFYGVGITVGPGNTESGVVDEVMVFDQWASLDIPMAVLVAKGFDSSNFFQFKIGAQSDIRTQLGYFDNLYFYDSTTLGTDEFTSVDFKVFPNPTKNTWNIKSKTTISAISVYDILGKQVFKADPNASEFSIGASQLNDGIYMAKIISNTGSKTIKLVKN